MPSNGTRTAPGGGSPLRGERRVVTALFCDVANSTALAERFDPEDWTEIISEAFARLTEDLDHYDHAIAAARELGAVAEIARLQGARSALAAATQAA